MHKTITSDKYKNLIDWLRLERLNSGITMRDLAVKINKPNSWIGKLETLERRLDVYEYVQYCKALNVSPEQGLDKLG